MNPEPVTPSGPTSSLAVRLNVAVLVVAALSTVVLPLSPFTTWLNGGQHPSFAYLAAITMNFWTLIGPLILLNVFWLVHGSRWRNSKGADRVDSGSPLSAQGGQGCGVVSLSVTTVVLLNGLMPFVLLVPLGLFYGSFHHQPPVSGLFRDVATGYAWTVLALLGAINLAWMVKAIAYRCTRPSVPVTPTDILDNPTPEPSSPHVTPATRSE